MVIDMKIMMLMATMRMMTKEMMMLDGRKLNKIFTAEPNGTKLPSNWFKSCCWELVQKFAMHSHLEHFRTFHAVVGHCVQMKVLTQLHLQPLTALQKNNSARSMVDIRVNDNMERSQKEWDLLREHQARQGAQQPVPVPASGTTTLSLETLPDVKMEPPKNCWFVDVFFGSGIFRFPLFIFGDVL